MEKKNHRRPTKQATRPGPSRRVDPIVPVTRSRCVTSGQVSLLLADVRCAPALGLAASRGGHHEQASVWRRVPLAWEMDSAWRLAPLHGVPTRRSGSTAGSDRFRAVVESSIYMSFRLLGAMAAAPSDWFMLHRNIGTIPSHRNPIPAHGCCNEQADPFLKPSSNQKCHRTG